MKKLLILNGILLLMSCAIPELGKRSQKISEDLIAAFNHQDIQISLQRGTEEEDNRVSIAFCKYEMADKCFNDLENLAARVKIRVLDQNPDLKQMFLVEVKFTREENDEELQNVVTFQFRN